LVGTTVLELGCGLGGLTREAASRGATRASGVDLSPVAIREAARLAAEAGLGDRIAFAVGDGARVELVPHDVVVLDKVICCYPEVEVLLENSLSATRRTYGLVVPLSSGWRGILARLAIGAENAIRWVRREAFRAFVHDVRRIEARIAEAGLSRAASATRVMWYVAVYERPD
jgi:magnesium-protoporphyrin O-methyltransferase